VAESYELRSYTEDLIPAVQAFNGRLLAGGIDRSLMYPEAHIPRFPPRQGARVYQQYFLLCDTAKNVRGGFILTQEQWSLYGETTWVAHLRLPISEGAVDRRFKAVAPRIFEAALSMQPNLYALGMGGLQMPYSRRIRSLGWSMQAVPFYFKLRSVGRFLKTSPYLRGKPAWRLAADLAAATGLGSLGIRATQFLGAMNVSRPAKVEIERVPCFSAWADEIWEPAHRCYGLIAPRDCDTLNARYPADEPRFLKLKFSRGRRVFGWAVLLDTQMRGNKYFGDARVGAIVDCFAQPENAAPAIQGATRYLWDSGVDLVVCNQAHRAWRLAAQRAGFLRGPSNYVFALSPEAAAMVHPFDRNFATFFVTRGDGAGPERLMA
jgi:hypothetical protein